MSRSDYEVVIGLEVHAELSTKTKIFCSCPTEFGAEPNTHICPICTAMPGALPVLNEKVVEYAVKAGLATNCWISQDSKNDRKNYFYPDNPKNYQITQNDTPIAYDGYVEIETENGPKKIYIEEMHIEEDTCKSTHRKDKTLLDFNRAGVPLIEIVTKPCIDSPEEAKLYLEKLKELLFYADISDCKMEEGSMRADANISLRKNASDPLGTKVEIKNIGSITNVKLALEKEAERQTKLLDSNKPFKEQTRRYDDKISDTVLMRVKETGNDYRYFPEPDIPYLIITDEDIENAKKTLPMTAKERIDLYQKLGVNELNSKKLVQNRELSDYFNELVDSKIDFNKAANLLLGDISSYLNTNEVSINNTKLTKDRFIDLVNIMSDGTISSKNLKDILNNVMEESKQIKELTKSVQNITDESFINDIVDKIISSNPDSVNDYKSGHDRAIKYLMGQVMKETKGTVNPSTAMSILKDKLDK